MFVFTQRLNDCNIKFLVIFHARAISWKLWFHRSEIKLMKTMEWEHPITYFKPQINRPTSLKLPRSQPTTLTQNSYGFTLRLLSLASVGMKA